MREMVTIAAIAAGQAAATQSLPASNAPTPIDLFLMQRQVQQQQQIQNAPRPPVVCRAMGVGVVCQ
jgi:hypothetical protein